MRCLSCKMEEMEEATVMGMMIQVITIITTKPDTKKVMRKDIMKGMKRVKDSMKKK